MTEEEVQAVEIRLLLEGIFRVYGYDFRDYAEASLARRLRKWLAGSGFNGFAEAQGRLLRDPDAFRGLLGGITVNVTEMFRDPAFFCCLREEVVPHLQHLSVREGLDRRLRHRRGGVLPGHPAGGGGAGGALPDLCHRRRPAGAGQRREGHLPAAGDAAVHPQLPAGGGKAAFSDYYTARYDHALLRPDLRRRIVFAAHNLAGDGEFGEMHLVLCRNVMIYFKPPLKERALGLFHACLLPGGFLCLGIKETLHGHAIAPHYEEFAPRLRVYRRRYA